MLWMALTGFIFIVLNAIMKKLSHELDPWLVGFLRYLLGALVMLAPALRLGARAFRSSAPALQFVRGLFHAGGMMLWFAALPFVTLPELTAIGFTGRSSSASARRSFLGERMSAARWAAVLIGFSGVLLVVSHGRPADSAASRTACC
jgi:drug/metabolite transporter (DMT)-like permease